MKNADRERFKSIVIASLLLIMLGLLLILGVSRWQPDMADEIAGIGISLLTAGILAITLDWISIRSTMHALRGVISDGLNEVRIRNYGISDVRKGTEYKDVYTSIENGDEFTLAQTWSPDMNNLLASCKTLLKRGGKIRIYLAHPESQSAKQRSFDLDREEDYVPGKVRSDIGEMRSLFSWAQRELDISSADAQELISLKLYSSLPSCAIYRTTDKAWVALYWLGVQSDAIMNLVINCNAGAEALKHVDRQIELLDRVAVEVDLSTKDIPPQREYAD